MAPGARQAKAVRWIGSSKEDLSDFPSEVRWRVGGAIWQAQLGGKAPYAKPLRGFGDAGVLEKRNPDAASPRPRTN